MRVSGSILSVPRLFAVMIATTLLLVAAPARADGEPAVGTPAASSRLDAVFKSLQDNTRGEPLDIRWKPLLIGAAGLAMMVFAIKQWNRRQAKPRAQSLHNHRKLLKQAARAAGVSASQLKTVAPVTQSQGLSSPLVAILCPSTIRNLAHAVKTAEQREALQALAGKLVKQEGR